MWVKMGLFILGGWVGASGGTMFFNAFFQGVFGKHGHEMYLCTLFISIIVAGMLAIYLLNHAMMLGSAICGSYSLVRGCSMFIGGFPNELLVYAELQNGSYADVSSI